MIPEPCNECGGTRWPVSRHEPHCSLFGLNEGGIREGHVPVSNVTYYPEDERSHSEQLPDMRFACAYSDAGVVILGLDRSTGGDDSYGYEANLTPDDAERLGNLLIAAAQKARNA